MAPGQTQFAAHTLRAVRLGYRLRQRGHRGLARCVRDLVGTRRAHRVRRRRDDRAAASFDEQRDGGTAGPSRREHDVGKRVVPVFVGRGEQVALALYAEARRDRDAAQDAELLGRRREGPLGRTGFGEVGHQPDAPPASIARERTRGAVGSRGVTPHERDGGAVGGERPRRGETDAAGAAEHHVVAAGDPEVHRVIVVSERNACK